MQNNRGCLFKYFRDSNLKLYNSKIKTGAYLDLETYFPEHSILENNWKEIQKEILGVMDSGGVLPKFHEVDDGQEYISDNDGLSWSLLNLMLYGVWYKKNAGLCPKTTSLLKNMKGVVGAYFSVLAPGKHIPPHKGPYKGIIRYQLALKVPKNGECKIFVGGIPYFWTEGKSVLFDDAYTHEAVNNTTEHRVVLLLDVKRKIPGFFMRQYDCFIFSLIQFMIILNGTFSKSEMK
ncbi:MAG TPA: aspartyl/asparaginyl beta-hydroxylase domain-containing protein [Flavobacteriales bacterium]|nr:aspartyl/asparaginyl beta-hydroxylase domain-containing protein [Flavobacteriales bacterium]